MSLSQWDLDNLSLEDQQKVLGYKDLWQSNPNQRDSAAAAAAQIRAKYGYSGGADGSQYIPIDSYAPPIAPDIPEFTSPYSGQVNELMDQVRNQKPYESPYEGLINQQMSQLINRPKFSYDAASDPAYQAFLQRATRAGDKAYADNLGGLSAMTGGRANSWAGTVASQARNEYMMQAQEAVVQFEDRAYSRYRDEGTDMYNLLNMLNTQDATAYGRYRDTIGDTKDLADMVLKLEDRDFEQYKYMADQQWKVFDTEYNAYNDALSFKKDKINEAIDRTNMLGYVNNQDSITLGMPSGTLSQSARERAEAMADYIAKQEEDIKQFRKEKEISHEFDIKLINAREKSDMKLINARGTVSSGGTSSGEFGGGEISAANLSSSERTKITSLYSEFEKIIGGDDFSRAKPGAKYKMIANYVDKVIKDVESGLYGKNSTSVGSMVLDRVYSNPIFLDTIEQHNKGLDKISDAMNLKTTDAIKTLMDPNYGQKSILAK